MSSGSYFPPPVRQVRIPKPDGGIRVLGVPTVADRLAQTVVALVLERRAEPVFHQGSYGYRPVDCWVFFGQCLFCASGCLLQVQEIAFGLVRGAIP